MGEWKVVGSRRYRGHETGTIFEARIGNAAAARAVRRGDIVLLRETTPSLEPGTYRLPPGWLQSSTPPTAPEGVFFMPKGGK